MKALTLRQPWASLVALGVKTIETRSWSTEYRGPLAIHAGMKRPPIVWTRWADPMPGTDPLLLSMADSYEMGHLFTEGEHDDGMWSHRWAGPLGAVVATCELVDVLPTVGWDTEQDCPDARGATRCVSADPDEPGGPFVRTWTYGVIEQQITSVGCWVGGIGDPVQLPYGDFTPGRYAWLLADVTPIDPVPAKGKQGLWEWAEQ